jgi:multiple sugar transport system permease protein
MEKTADVATEKKPNEFLETVKAYGSVIWGKFKKHWENNRHPEEDKIEYKKTPVQTVLNVLMYASLVIAALLVILPIYIVFVASLKTNQEIFSSNALLFTSGTWSNYADAWNFNAKMTSNPSTMGTAFSWTILISVFSIALTIMSGSFVAYVLSRFSFHGKSVLKALFLIASIVPSVTMQVSLYGLMAKMNLIDKPIALVLLYSGTDIISIYIFLQFMDNLPRDLDEAALVDGCNSFQVFFKIIFPLMKPAISTVVIIKGIGFYNDFYIPSLYMKNHFTVSTYLNSMNQSFGTTWGVICAAVIIAILPTIVIFCLLQNQIYSGLTSGAVKS